MRSHQSSTGSSEHQAQSSAIYFAVDPATPKLYEQASWTRAAPIFGSLSACKLAFLHQRLQRAGPRSGGIHFSQKF